LILDNSVVDAGPSVSDLRALENKTTGMVLTGGRNDILALANKMSGNEWEGTIHFWGTIFFGYY